MTKPKKTKRAAKPEAVSPESYSWQVKFDQSDSWERSGHHLLQFFSYSHLPPKLQAVSKPFNEMAAHILLRCPRNFSAITALRKLLESKDAAVRSVIADKEQP